MTTLAVRQCYLLLPVLVLRLRSERQALLGVPLFLKTARAELDAWSQEFFARQERYRARRPSRIDKQFSMPCFETEARWLALMMESLHHLEQYALSGTPCSLHHSLVAYDASDKQFAHLIRLRKALPSGVEEEMQRAA